MSVQRTINEELKFDAPIWKFVKREALDFITKTLDKEPVKRLTIEGILDHEWLRSQEWYKSKFMLLSKWRDIAIHLI